MLNFCTLNSSILLTFSGFRRPVILKAYAMETGSGGADDGDDVVEVDPFVPHEEIFNKFAAMLYTSDNNGKSFYEFKDARFCPSCGEKVGTPSELRLAIESFAENHSIFNSLKRFKCTRRRCISSHFSLMVSDVDMYICPCIYYRFSLVINGYFRECPFHIRRPHLAKSFGVHDQFDVKLLLYFCHTEAATKLSKLNLIENVAT